MSLSKFSALALEGEMDGESFVVGMEGDENGESFDLEKGEEGNMESFGLEKDGEKGESCVLDGKGDEDGEGLVLEKEGDENGENVIFEKERVQGEEGGVDHSLPPPDLGIASGSSRIDAIKQDNVLLIKLMQQSMEAYQEGWKSISEYVETERQKIEKKLIEERQADAERLEKLRERHDGLDKQNAELAKRIEDLELQIAISLAGKAESRDVGTNPLPLDYTGDDVNETEDQNREEENGQAQNHRQTRNVVMPAFTKYELGQLQFADEKAARYGAAVSIRKKISSSKSAKTKAKLASVSKQSCQPGSSNQNLPEIDGNAMSNETTPRKGISQRGRMFKPIRDRYTPDAYPAASYDVVMTPKKKSSEGLPSQGDKTIDFVIRPVAAAAESVTFKEVKTLTGNTVPGHRILLNEEGNSDEESVVDDMSEEAFMRRHAKHEAEEKKIKRRDLQSQQETKTAGMGHQKGKIRIRRSGNAIRRPFVGAEEEEKMEETYAAGLQKLKAIHVSSEIPPAAFGQTLPLSSTKSAFHFYSGQAPPAKSPPRPAPPVDNTVRANRSGGKVQPPRPPPDLPQVQLFDPETADEELHLFFSSR